MVCGMRRTVVVTHDKSVFSSHYGRNPMRTFEAHKKFNPMRQGRSKMVFELMWDGHGPLRLHSSMDPS